MPWDGLKWILVEESGWTLEYIDNLDLADVFARNAVRRGQYLATKGK